jgi:hypothetical protein
MGMHATSRRARLIEAWCDQNADGPALKVKVDGDGAWNLAVAAEKARTDAVGTVLAIGNQEAVMVQGVRKAHHLAVVGGRQVNMTTHDMADAPTRGTAWDGTRHARTLNEAQKNDDIAAVAILSMLTGRQTQPVKLRQGKVVVRNTYDETREDEELTVRYMPVKGAILITKPDGAEVVSTCATVAGDVDAILASTTSEKSKAQGDGGREPQSASTEDFKQKVAADRMLGQVSESNDSQDTYSLCITAEQRAAASGKNHLVVGKGLAANSKSDGEVWVYRPNKDGVIEGEKVSFGTGKDNKATQEYLTGWRRSRQEMTKTIANAKEVALNCALGPQDEPPIDIGEGVIAAHPDRARSTPGKVKVYAKDLNTIAITDGRTDRNLTAGKEESEIRAILHAAGEARNRTTPRGPAGSELIALDPGLAKRAAVTWTLGANAIVTDTEENNAAVLWKVAAVRSRTLQGPAMAVGRYHIVYADGDEVAQVTCMEQEGALTNMQITAEARMDDAARETLTREFITAAERIGTTEENTVELAQLWGAPNELHLPALPVGDIIVVTQPGTLRAEPGHIVVSMADDRNTIRIVDEAGEVRQEELAGALIAIRGAVARTRHTKSGKEEAARKAAEEKERSST